ncbi:MULTISPECIES: aspartate transaminase [Variovorax]|jgi:aspartate aminotransferase|uniref:aspartate transaminase n=1 Tax=Variovorax TaxID=34072 RepID=UPI0008695915|nr:MULTISPECIES: aspartate transaminase [Variovorax]MBN8757805.1 aspartate transaminase [Variovorax sp.]ODU18065.1 MAG: aspartate aminotransferase [Variovorax sp. SCN 67-85]ODV24600.1 MAG: aspartate aminotransferase [Variovorax sp. SCN 67-20]OJZ13462.1 MAG: aspartate aminotransferase [Variovorax sp. 67-131]UKI06105.1 aspartate transaminase [Variovorax paradoxus]
MQATTSRIAARVRRIKPSPSTSAADRANELRRQGKSIVNLVVGEPDFDTPAHIRQAAAAAIERGATRYTLMAGTVELREAIVAKLERENGLRYAMNEIIATSGAKSAIYNAFAITLEPGDEVIIPAPYWVSYPDMVLACEGTPVTVACPESQGFKLAPAQLEAAITPRTRWLLLNSPSNPTGASYTAQEYRALAEVLERHPHVMVMTDEIYEHIRFDGETTPHILVQAPSLRDRTLIVNGVSKTYAMTGWRIGYAAGPVDLIKALDTLLSQSTGNCCSVSQAAAAAALNGDQSFVAESVAVYRQRRDRTLALVNEIPGLSCATPPGAFYLYINCGGLIGKTTPEGKRLDEDGDVVMYLLESEGVAVVAGTAYGLSPYFRLSIATSIETLEEGCKRMARAVAALR